MVFYTQSNITVISGQEDIAMTDNYRYLGFVVKWSGKLQCGSMASTAGELFKAGDDDCLVLLHVLHEQHGSNQFRTGAESNLLLKSMRQETISLSV